MKTLDHPFIASLFEVLEDDSHFYFALEYASGGSLVERINEQTVLSESEARHVFHELAVALDYLHNRRRIVHRDVKAENILLDDHRNIRLADFGFARAVTKLNPLMHTTCGSPPYMSPEVVGEEAYTAAADIWSAGILLYAMLVGRFPFRAVNFAQLVNEIRTATPEIPAHLSPGVAALLMKCLAKNPRARVSVSGILQDPWIVGGPTRPVAEAAMIALLKVHDVLVLDEAVVADMRRMGYDTTGLAFDVKGEVLNSRTAAYRMMKKASVMEGLARWHEISLMESRRETLQLSGRETRRPLPPLRTTPSPRVIPVVDPRVGTKLWKRKEVSRSSMTPPPLPPGLF
jgi:serine/threonine protein kinase